MSKNLAVLITEAHQKVFGPAKETELWEPAAGEVLLKVESAAQNPVDWKQVDHNFAIPAFPHINGVDVAGVVEKLGEGVTGLQVGDRVCTMTPLGKAAKYGVFQQYCVAKEIACVKIPASWSFDDASTLPLAFFTAAPGIHSGLQIPYPLDASNKLVPKAGPGETLLVWGGSSSVGALAVQVAKIAGFRVIATASPRNFEYVKSLGADVVLDYHDADIVGQIKAACPDLALAYDAITENGSTETIFSCFGPKGGQVLIVLGFKGAAPPEEVKIRTVFAGRIYESEQETRRITEYMQLLLDQGKLKPNPVKVMPNGLNSLDEGFDLMRQGKVSGQKLVYHPQETA